MRKSKAVRVAGFVGALGASAALVGFAATGTGAYFTDSHPGEVQASTGHVKVDIGPADGKLSFVNLLPGEYKTQQLKYTANGTEGEDVWLVFPTDDGTGVNPSEAFTGNPSEAFTGASNDTFGGGLGRYGHLAVTSNKGSFTSYNLNNGGNTPGVAGADPKCYVDANGHGGSNVQATDRSDYTVPYCAAPTAILLDSNLANGQTATAHVTFGYTPLLKLADAQNVSYQIVATQHGNRPDTPKT
jgi:hypothetical protein